MDYDRRCVAKLFNLSVELLALTCLPVAGLASDMHATHKWAWSENAGYLNFQATNASVSAEYAATVHLNGDNGYMKGWAWGESVGWIRLGNTNGGVPYANADATNWGVNVVGTNLGGFAWSETAGWVNFAPTHATVVDRVTLNTANGQFASYAWNEMFGWIHVRGAGETPLYVLEVAQGTTGVVLYDFFLRVENGQVQVCWNTASEENSAGFDVSREENGAWVKVNDSLIDARDPMGASYCGADAGANATDTFRYKLVEVETDGGMQTYGPFERAVWTTRPENVAVTPEGVVIRWLSRAGDTYEILKSGDLLRGFAPLATNLPATPPVNGYTDRTDKASSFYLIGSE